MHGETPAQKRLQRADPILVGRGRGDPLLHLADITARPHFVGRRGSIPDLAHGDREEMVCSPRMEPHRDEPAGARRLDLSRVGPTRFVVLGVSTTPVRFPPLEADFELGVGTVIDTIDFWRPLYLDRTDSRDAEDRLVNVVAKLRPGVTVAQAQAEMDAIARRQAEEYPEAHEGWEVRVVPLRQQMAEGSRDAVLLLSAATGLLLLIACANVGTLLLARGVARRREVAIRAALGAGRWRIARQFLIEATVLAGGAGALGVTFASWAIELARPWLPGSLPALQEMTINPSVLAFALASAGLTAAVTGVAPALRAARSRGERLTGRAARGTTDGTRTRLVGVLVAAEVALTVVLLLGAGLLARSALRAAQVQPGFNPASLLTMTVALPENKFDWNHNAAFARDVMDAVRSLPSVIDAAVVQGIPMGDGGFFGNRPIEGHVTPPGAEDPVYRLRVVSPSYFETMQIPILSGREFEARDEVGERGFNRTILVSASFARRYWPGQNPLGRRIASTIGTPDWWMTVVGVVGDVRYTGLEAAPTEEVYLPAGLYPQAVITLVARTAGDPRDETPEVLARIRDVDPHDAQHQRETPHGPCHRPAPASAPVARESERGRDIGDAQCRDVGHDAESEDRAASQVAAREEVVEPQHPASGHGFEGAGVHAGQGQVRSDPVEADSRQAQERQRPTRRDVSCRTSMQCPHRLPPEPPRGPAVLPLFIQVAHQRATGILKYR